MGTDRVVQQMQMCEVTTYSDIQVNAFDPTRTTVLRNAFAREMGRRFRQLKSVISEAIIDQDCFGLITPTSYTELFSPNRRAFAFTRTSDKVDAFMKWLQQQEDRGLLETRTFQQVGESIESAWTNRFIYDSYKRGVMRARSELRKQGYEVPSVEQSGGVEAIMSAPFHVDTVGVLYTRVFTELRGITATMDTMISQVLSQGLIDGDHPRVLTRKLLSLIDVRKFKDLKLKISYINPRTGRPVTYWMAADRRAEMLARTEIIRAHHMANIQEYKSWGAEGVVVEAEWTTAMDDRVCDMCAGMHGNRYTLREIEQMIPAHPMCRCIAMPVEKKRT